MHLTYLPPRGRLTIRAAPAKHPIAVCHSMQWPFGHSFLRLPSVQFLHGPLFRLHSKVGLSETTSPSVGKVTQTVLFFCTGKGAVCAERHKSP